jgi:hypothetical protein
MYDQAMGRYHIVPAISMSAGGNPRNPQIPVGYILQLAVKHLEAHEPEVTHSAPLATAYRAGHDLRRGHRRSALLPGDLGRDGSESAAKIPPGAGAI